MSAEPSPPRYRLLYRPVSFCTIPKVHWSWVEIPVDYATNPGLAHLPVSQHRWGVFTTERPLTDAEMRAFEIVTVAA